MFEIKHFSKVSSTNDIAKRMAEEGAADGTVIVADEQTSGRGRMGRSFMSPCGTGLYMSVILRPTLSAESSLLITTAAAVATALTIEKHSGKKTAIKWVNDIFVNGKKVCGILTEGKLLPCGTPQYAILGIGVNLTSPKDGFGNLSNIAGAVFENENYNKNAFICDILEAFFKFYEKLDAKLHYDGYASRDMLRGKEVDVIRAGEVLYSAKTLGIDRDFSLIIMHDGKKENLTSGEVSVKEK